MASRTQTLVQLTDELRELLDRRAAELGVSRSKLIRQLLEQGLAEARADEHSRRLVEGYTSVPQADARDAWGDLERWTDVNVSRNLASLAEEEPA